MLTETIGESGKYALIEEWGGIDAIDANVIEALLFDENTWGAVRERATSRTIAIFDIRSVPPKSPNYYKSLRLYFAPYFASIDEDDSDKLEPIMQQTSEVLNMVLMKLLTVAEDSQDKKAKIFSTHPVIAFLFREICRYFVENYPNRYSYKSYNNWIEIQTK